MGQPKRRCSGQEMNRVDIKMGGGGIGAVVLMGGALAAAALASAFLMRKSERSSAENRRHLRRNTPPTVANELKNINEQVEGRTGLQYVLLETPSQVEKHTSVSRREIEESDSEDACLVSIQILKRDEKAGIEINGEKAVCDSDRKESEQMLRFISGKCMEIEDFSEGLLVNKQVILPLGENLNFEPKNQMHAAIELGKGYDRYKQVFIEEEAIEKTMDVAGDCFELSERNGDNQEKVFVVSSLSEDGREALGCNEIRHENVNGDERGVLPSEILEIIEEDKAVEGGPEVEIKHVEEKLAEEGGGDNQTHEEIVSVEESPFADYDKNLIVSTLVAMPNEESTDVANEEVVYQQKGQENEVKENMGDLIVGKSEDENIIGSDDETDEDEESSSEWADDSSSGTGDSSVEESNQELPRELWQAKLINQKLEVNIQEEGTKEDKCKIIKKEMAIINPTRWGILIGVLFLLSSIFCSWFLSLSSIEFCFIMFITIVLSKVSDSICTRDRSCKWPISEPSTKAAT